MINDTDVPRGGFIQILFVTDPIYPNSGDTTSLEFDLVNKARNSIQKDVDYQVSINQGSNQIYEIHLTQHKVSVSIPFKFKNSGTYQIVVEINGMSFQQFRPRLQYLQ